MTHAILMTVYKDPQLINFIINLYPDEFYIYIYIDKKSYIKPEDLIMRKRMFIYKEYTVNWGGVNHFRAMLLLLKHAVKNQCDYYHWVTGQDFPLSPELFDKKITEGYSYLEYYKLKESDAALRYFQRYGLYDFLDAKNKYQQPIINIINRIQDHFHYTRPFRDYGLLYAGSGYSTLYKDDAQILLHEFPHWDKFYRFTFCCEESIIQTILINNARKDYIINNNLRYIEWNKPWNSDIPPRILTECDYDMIKASNALFCRKIDRHISEGLIAKLLS